MKTKASVRKLDLREIKRFKCLTLGGRNGIEEKYMKIGVRERVDRTCWWFGFGG